MPTLRQRSAEAVRAGQAGCSVVTRGGWGDLAGPKNARLGVGEWGGLDDGAGAAGQGDGVQPAEFDLDASLGQAGAAFGNAGEQQRQPAQQYVRPDAGFDAVEHRPQLERALEVAEAAFSFEQVLVAQRDVLGGQVRVGGGQQVLAVQPLLRRDLRLVEDEPAGGQLPQPPPERRVVPQRALGLRRAPARSASSCRPCAARRLGCGRS